MQEPRNLSWTHFNKTRRFPLLFGSTPVSADGYFTIPDDLIVSLYLSCNVGSAYTDPERFYIGSLTYYSTGFVLTIHYGPARERVAETTVDLSLGEMPVVVQLLGLNPMVLSGMVVLGDKEGLLQQPTGEWEFAPEATTLDPFCIRYVARELAELYVQSHGRLMGPFRDKITFAEGENVTLGIRTDAELNCLEPAVSGTEIVIHAIEPENISACVRTINSVKPDMFGNITFKGQDCLDIRPEGEHTLVFADTCAEPCCTCAELAPIEEKIQEISASIQQLASRIETLKNQYDFMQHSLSAAGSHYW
jgi:outer membrane murein-binding lipoprotein Lpp